MLKRSPHYPQQETTTFKANLARHGCRLAISAHVLPTYAEAVHKKLYRVPVGQLIGSEIGGELPLVTKEVIRDFVRDLAASYGYVVDKVESFAIDPAGTGFVITDNDGIADSSGETLFWSIGAMN